jgi:hypothetical protein
MIYSTVYDIFYSTPYTVYTKIQKIVKSKTYSIMKKLKCNVEINEEYKIKNLQSNE